MDTFELVKLKDELERDEGRSSALYLDSKGIATIGVGWNLQENGLPPGVIDTLFDLSVSRAIEDVRSLVSNYDELAPARQRVLANMAFNLGRGRLSKFKKMLAAVEAGEWDKAAAEMLDSKWPKQVGKRSYRLADLMRYGR